MAKRASNNGAIANGHSECQDRKSASSSSSNSLALNPTKQVETGSNSSDSSAVQFKRELGLFGGINLLIGNLIGSGVFVFPGVVIAYTLSVWTGLLIWFVGGLVAIAGAMCYAELGTLFTQTGDDYLFIHEGVGPLPAFLKIWTAALVQQPGGIALQVQAFASYLLAPIYPCGAPTSAVKTLAVFGLLCFAFINAAGTRFLQRSSIVFTISKLLGCAFIITVGLVRISMGHVEYLQPDFGETSSDISKIALAAYGVMFCYDGYNIMCTAREELKNPRRDIPLSIFISVPLVVLFYGAVNVAYFTVLSKTEVIESRAVAVEWMTVLFGNVVSYLMCFVVALSILGAGNSAFYGNVRRLYAASRHGQFFRIFGMLHVHNGIPIPSLIFNTLLSLLYCIPSISTLLNSYSFMTWLTQFLVAVSLIRLRYSEKYKNAPRAYRVPLVVVVFFMIATGYLVIGPLIQSPDVGVVYASLFTLSGLLFYVPFLEMGVRIKSLDRWIQRMTLRAQIITQSAEPDSC